MEIGIFREVKGLQMTVPFEEIKEGGQNGYVHRVPGRISWENITFTGGLTQSDALFDWVAKTSGEGFAANQNQVTRCTGAITAISHVGDRLRSWELQDVVPIQWRGPEFGIDQRSVLEETLTIAHNGLRPKTHGKT